MHRERKSERKARDILTGGEGGTEGKRRRWKTKRESEAGERNSGLALYSKPKSDEKETRRPLHLDEH